MQVLMDIREKTRLCKEGGCIEIRYLYMDKTKYDRIYTGSLLQYVRKRWSYWKGQWMEK